MFQLIKNNLDYKHYGSNAYCVKYFVYYNAPEWSTNRWYTVVGLTADGCLVDLLPIGYVRDYGWLIAGEYTE